MGSIRSERSTAAGTGYLDNPVWWSLVGPHAHLAERRGDAGRYDPDVSPFAAVPDAPSPADWADLAALTGPDTVSLVIGALSVPPGGWATAYRIDGIQMVGDAVVGAPDDEAVRLGPADAAEVLDLAARTRPGPFRPRTMELGTYLGIRRGGRLVAMAGERLRPPGWTEVSAVCTDPAHRGQGLGARLILAVAAGIQARGEVPFLHVAADNVAAIRLYATLGFRTRLSTRFFGTSPRADVPG